MAIIQLDPGNLWSSINQQKVRNSAVGDIIEVPPGSHTLDAQFQFLGGATVLRAQGAIIRVGASATTTCGVLIRDKVGCRVQGGIWEYARTAEQTALFHMIDSSNCRITDVYINGLYKSRAVMFEARDKSSTGNVASGVYVEWHASAPYETDGYPTFSAKTKLTFHPGTSTQNASTRAGTVAGPGAIRNSATFVNCTTNGGYYGFDLSGVSDTNIRYCTTRNNVRGVSCQDTSTRVRIRNVSVYENRSAGIHIAYGSNDVHVDDCLVYSTRADGEGLMQAYVGHNQVRFNNCALYSGKGPAHYLYTALGGTTGVTNVSIRGMPATKSVVASESAWNPAVKGVWHSRRRADPSNEGLEQNRNNILSIRGITVALAELKSPAFVASSLTSKYPDTQGQLTIYDGRYGAGGDKIFWGLVATTQGRGYVYDVPSGASELPYKRRHIQAITGSGSAPEALVFNENPDPDNWPVDTATPAPPPPGTPPSPTPAPGNTRPWANNTVRTMVGGATGYTIVDTSVSIQATDSDQSDREVK